jgi:hypothetical protein
MTTRARALAGSLAAVGAAMVLTGCTLTVTGTATRPIPGLDEDSRSPVDVDAVLLDRPRMQAATGAGTDLTPIPGTDSKSPVDIDVLSETVPPQCHWVYAETEVFGREVEEFHKTSYQDPPRGALISQAAAGYRDPDTARRALAGLADRVQDCARTAAGGALVGELSRSGDAVHIRPGGCGRDYRVKSAVLVEVTFCAFPDSVPGIVMTNILAAVPG